MNYLRDLIYRLRCGESERRIAQDGSTERSTEAHARRLAKVLGVSRTTVHKYREWAATQGYLEAERPLPDAATLSAALGIAPRPPRAPSSVEPHREVVQRLLEQGVERMAIFQRLQEHHGYQGSYSSVRRFVHHLRPAEPEVVVRVHSAPGEEAQASS